MKIKRALNQTDPIVLWPAEVFHLLGDSSQPERKLAGKPNVSFEEFVTRKVEENMPKLWKITVQRSVEESLG